MQYIPVSMGRLVCVQVLLAANLICIKKSCFVLRIMVPFDQCHPCHHQTTVTGKRGSSSKDICANTEQDGQALANICER